MGAATWMCVALAACGAALIVGTLRRARRVAPDFGEFFDQRDYGGEEEPRLAGPLLTRLFGGVARTLAARLEQLVPANYLAKLDHQLTQAGLSRKRRAGQQLAIQLGLALAGLALAPLMPTKSSLTGTLAIVLLPVMGFMLPAARLKRSIRSGRRPSSRTCQTSWTCWPSPSRPAAGSSRPSASCAPTSPRR